ncbi:hypothetical protein G7Y79_00042g078200 [Physcia stellaris]|nr:hypothetical protein G7Y79_00042g078200 [Physcia stellaris]
MSLLKGISLLALAIPHALSYSPVDHFVDVSQEQIPLNGRERSPFSREFNDLVSSILDHWHVPGLSIAIVDNNSTCSKVIPSRPFLSTTILPLTSIHQGYGISTFPSQPVTPSTLFYTGSTTKAFTAAALALLMDDSNDITSAPTSPPKLTWRTRLASLIPSSFVLPSSYATTHLTLEDAASHRTGMPRHDIAFGVPNFTLEDEVRSLRHLPMTAEPRVRFQYCNIMYMALSHALETLTGQWLGDVLRSRIWMPLGMNRTFFSLSQARNSTDACAELATGYVWINRTRKYVALEHLDLGFLSGAGAVISNVQDYATWLRFLIEQAPPLSKEGHAQLRTARIMTPTQPIFTGTSAYGLGWDLVNYHGEPLIWHNGGVPGFGALVGYLPRKGWGVAMMGNTAETSNLAQEILAFKLLDDRLGVPEKERVDLGAGMEAGLVAAADRIRHPRKHLFPDAPAGKDVIPLSRPLEAYTGIYWHPGYRGINITLSPIPFSSSFAHSEERHLQIKLDRLLPFVVDLTHVSGEFFILTGRPDRPDDEVDKDNPIEVHVVKSEFRIGENGSVMEFGAAVEEEMGEEKIWWRRVE